VEAKATMVVSPWPRERAKPLEVREDTIEDEGWNVKAEIQGMLTTKYTKYTKREGEKDVEAWKKAENWKLKAEI
jgi:hypothetical protein